MTKELKAVEAAQQALTNAMADLQDTRGRRRLHCAACLKFHPIKTLDLLITHGYVEPRGCTGGDYWKEGEWQFVCPETKVRNRLLFDDWALDPKDRSVIGVAAAPTFKALYRDAFKTEQKTYGEAPETGPWVNNYYADQNRKRFELPRARLEGK